ncbi:MAG: DegT/DnrJ/EryC1/StrS family aminotransferase [Chlorobium sp.]|jgi:8-amino-3,8-dideoxy-alpha-D-manno-octulosonate transaminase|uniref:DegT/DnrJ/EryC1/StrS aminotransferase family protein n=1 Tax=Chlorobium sp. TaxID=1095 RepID=UPI001D240E50|nr:DegT/DnrJ/EryC1/StrS family aminotransferase [Chlorobium sp.]MBN1278833.1 DegT/DnrJ/EryC1/StrS family aminotransferase [Chlorobiaceae bacterium]MCF8217168.1 DegT/DnrJ/EryC1/StrS family aminotransferase [Chlorobium sp.]MCF8272015.1 DegT/DnrJ/EryC1/StrS family aminotransferase [Chlorobium sp.]MCF8288386.1 DegT/DnrJ/EryC1/StrS family aminotransferase [Chlorobium sp.]MCF8291977.1 DegT/DnrJ/EryC1/StrS family aminotransferase [Chlorobium sp.]
MAGAELIGREELAEIQDLFSGDKVNLYRYGGGNYKARELEERFAEYMGVKYAHAVSSGTAAIHCALAGAGIGPGDEVITTAWTFIAPVEAISALGALPVPVEIDETYHLDPAEVEKAITPATKAVVAIPMWASPKMAEIAGICEKYDIMLIEDAAQALGATYRGRKLGTIGKVGSFSFDAGKTMHTGEGGIIVTDDKDIYDRAAEFSDHGHMHLDGLPRGKDPRRAKGLNLRLSEVTAAIGLAQLAKIDLILLKSRENKKRIKDAIRHIDNIMLRPFSDENGSQGDTLIFRVRDREAALQFEAHLMERGFGTKILPEALDWHFAGVWSHLLPEYDRYKGIDLETLWPKTGTMLRSSICLNIPVLMDDVIIEKLVEAIITGAKEIG